ncbi:sugar ABC transporter permease [Xaviernesmea oryzae]|uniref:sugar ABC transporter permease n=1 Tax=Xaviernesmea oryzae TaxID=464029 RepID=UPI00117A913E|nr:sugar ABC transporter permease [Xaviernesmea oryzae]
MIEISRRNGPLIASALLSVLDWNLLSSDVRFAGLDNYEAILASVDFRMAAWNIYLWDQLVLEDKFKEILTSGIATFADLEGNRTRLGTADGDQPLVDRARPRHIPGRAAFHRRCARSRLRREIGTAKCIASSSSVPSITTASGSSKTR